MSDRQRMGPKVKDLADAAPDSIEDALLALGRCDSEIKVAGGDVAIDRQHFPGSIADDHERICGPVIDPVVNRRNAKQVGALKVQDQEVTAFFQNRGDIIGALGILTEVQAVRRINEVDLKLITGKASYLERR